jgi:hypothetical protein
MKRCIRLAAAAAMCILSLQLTGCAQLTMTPPKPTIENTVKLRGKALTPAAVGAFSPDPRILATSDKGASIRGNGLRSPVNGSFAQYLRETLKVELQSAGLYDPDAGTVISGTLAESEVDASVGAGKASLAARILVTRAGKVRYDRELRVNTAWDSPFVGVVAVPLAAGEYERLYRSLAGTLFDDASFGQALAKD